MIRPAAIFKNGMVLQRNSVVRIFGESDANTIEVEFCGKKYSAMCRNNRWQMDLPTDDSSEKLSLKITACDHRGECAESIMISDILLGEVWLAGGQSNMELELKNSLDGERIADESDYPSIRFYNVPKISVIDDALTQAEESAGWKPAVGALCKEVSAVAYYFALEMYEKLKVPIGIIGCYFGGTSATCWMDEASAKTVTEVSGYIEAWREAVNNTTDHEYDLKMAEYNMRYNTWNQKVEELRSKKPNITWNEINSIAGQCPWPQPRGRRSPFRPFGLYESMLKRIIPYRIKGIIYYQGEEDVDKADYYCKLNSAVIRRWREDFGEVGKESELPFYITQLPMYDTELNGADKSWCILRQQQELCSIVNENVHITVLIDYGEFDNIHPINKKIPGQRIAYRVLKSTYGMKDIPVHMKLEHVSFEGNLCTLSFSDTYGAICYRKSDGIELTAESGERIPLQNDNCEEVLGFDVSCDGEKFFAPEVAVEGTKIILSTNDAKAIKRVRYGWSNYGVANLYNGRGMPLAPFNV
ncbi:MAG: sialate O-acetylesterase [Butyrivibrio sp.]|nr:sialate O-acetylesterase [Butyrivibrio sp.]